LARDPLCLIDRNRGASPLPQGGYSRGLYACNQQVLYRRERWVLASRRRGRASSARRRDVNNPKDQGALTAAGLTAARKNQVQTMSTSLDLNALKARQQAAWASGDYAVIGTTLQLVGERLAEACDLRWDEKVLDVAAGNGNATLAAARRGCQVTSTDYVPELLKRGEERARAEHLNAVFQTADAEALPFADGAFDAVISTFGVMFAPDQAQAARELARVCRSGGRIGLANWTPQGFIGQMFKTLGRHVPPPAGAQPPSRWGDEEQLQQLFGDNVGVINVSRQHFNFRYRSAAHFIEVFRTWYGPVHKAFASLQSDAAYALERDLAQLLNDNNVAGASSLVVPSEYLEVVISRR